MLNMASFYKFSQLDFGIVAMLLCIIVMVTSMILIHCVIAIMSITVTDMFEQRAKIQRVYRLHVALRWQHNIKEPFHRLFKNDRLQILTPGLKFENGRIHVSCYEVEV